MTDTTQADIRAAAQDYARRAARNKVLGSIAGRFVTWLIVFALSFVTTYYGAYVLSWQWHWFMEPSGFDPLSLRERIGLSFISGMLLTGSLVTLVLQISETAQKEDTLSPRLMAFTRLLGIAWVITMSWAAGWIWNWMLP